MWNIINSIISIRTSIITTSNLLPASIRLLHSFILLRSLQSLSKLSSSRAYLAIIRLVVMTLPCLVLYSAISFPVAAFISTISCFKLYPSFNLKALERRQLNDICQYMGSLISCLGAYNRMYSSSSTSRVMMHLNIPARQYWCVKPQWCSMTLCNSSRC